MLRAATLLFLLALAIGVASADAAKQRAVGLPGGFAVVPGSTLVGDTAFPWVIAATPPFEDHRGWVAIIGVEGDRRSVYDGYALQARRKGFDLPFSDQACSTDTNANVLCGAFDRRDGQFSIETFPCDVCGPYRSLMQITSYLKVGVPKRSPLPGGAPTSAAPNEPYSPQPSTGTGSSPPGTVRAPLGPNSSFQTTGTSTLLASADVADCFGGGNLAVVRVDGSGRAAFRRYAERLQEVSETPVRIASAMIQGRPAREAAGDWARVRLVDVAGPGATVYVDECFD